MILNPEQYNTRIGFVRKTLYDYQRLAPTAEFSLEKPAAGRVANLTEIFKKTVCNG